MTKPQGNDEMLARIADPDQVTAQYETQERALGLEQERVSRSPRASDSEEPGHQYSDLDEGVD
jgi:hypothetical protein